MKVDDKGSVTVEAAMVFPLLLAIMLLLINMLNVMMVQNAMDHAVSEAVKQIASYSFPMADIRSRAEEINLIDDAAKAAEEESPFLTGTGSLLEAFREYLRSGAADILEAAIREFAEKEMASHLPLAGTGSDGRIQMTDFKIVNPLTNNEKNQGRNPDGDKDIVITIKYLVPLRIPFCPLKEVSLISTATERAWVD